MNDEFYTPESLARDLISLSQQQNPECIADFAVGGGSLLAAARNRWPKSQLHGVDLNPAALAEAHQILPSIQTYASDYLSDDALWKTKELLGAVNLIVLNPPFTCRGSSFELTEFEGALVKSSKAMAFILRSCRYMHLNGEILAIVPRSCLFSQKDKTAREAISKLHMIEDLGAYQRPGFRRASVQVHLVRISRLTESAILPTETKCEVKRVKPNRAYRLVFIRGSHPVSAGVLDAEGPSLIHTTDLFNSEISISRRRAVRLSKLVSGTVLMLPRVARPTLNKVSVGTFIQPVIPSDCIICVKTQPPGYENHLQEQIRVFWGLLQEAYSGTCAPYLSMEAFKKFVESIGFDAEAKYDEKIWNPIANTSVDSSSTIGKQIN